MAMQLQARSLSTSRVGVRASRVSRGLRARPHATPSRPLSVMVQSSDGNFRPSGMHGFRTEWVQARAAVLTVAGAAALYTGTLDINTVPVAGAPPIVVGLLLGVVISAFLTVGSD